MIECVLIRWNEPEKLTYEIINWNKQLINPNVVGLDNDLEYLEKTIPNEQPTFDSRLFNLIITQEFKDEESVNPPLRKWEITYSLQDKNKEQKKISIVETEQLASEEVMPMNQFMRFTVMYCIILKRKIDGLSISTEQQDILDKYETKGLSIWQNWINGLTKKSDIDIDNSIDIDSGWNSINPNPED